MPVQKQSSAGQRTRFKAFVAVGDSNGHIGMGVKCSSEVANAIRGAITSAKLNVAPVRRGYWGRKNGLPHTVPCKVTGKCGSVSVRLIPAPRGTGLVSSPAGKKLMHMAGVKDCYSSAQGHTRTMGNYIMAIFYALRSTYGYLSPELWPEIPLLPSPYQEHTDFLAKKQVKFTGIVTSRSVSEFMLNVWSVFGEAERGMQSRVGGRLGDWVCAMPSEVLGLSLFELNRPIDVSFRSIKWVARERDLGKQERGDNWIVPPCVPLIMIILFQQRCSCEQVEHFLLQMALMGDTREKNATRRTNKKHDNDRPRHKESTHVHSNQPAFHSFLLKTKRHHHEAAINPLH
eukprot:scaffold539_cov144-Amphora_coffeaeformis.AAC.1